MIRAEILRRWKLGETSPVIARSLSLTKNQVDGHLAILRKRGHVHFRASLGLKTFGEQLREQRLQIENSP